MHPILFRIPVPNWNIPGIGPLHQALSGGQIPIYSYGVMLGLSLVVGWYLTLWLADKDGLPKETMANCYVATAVAALIGARLMYVVTNLDEFTTLGQVLAFRHGGLVAYGGFLGGYLGSWAFLHYKKLPLMPWADVAVPSLASGLGITRIGCYLFGCDFGKPLSSSAPTWLKHAGTFPHWASGTMTNGDGPPAWAQHVHDGLLSPDAAASLPVHPTQIYESLVGWTLLALLLLQRKHLKFRGQVFMLFAFSYGFARFCLEIVRDDAERGMYGPSLAQHILLPGALVIFAIAYIISFSREIQDVMLRRVTQAVSFVPAIYAYITLRPAAYATPEVVQLSTSQWVGLITAIAVAIAFPIFWKAAEAHPAEAMSLRLDKFHEEETGGKKRRKKKKKTNAHKGEVVEAKFDNETSSNDEDSSNSEVVDASFDSDKGDKDSSNDEVVDASFDSDKDDKNDSDSSNDEVVDASFDSDKDDKDDRDDKDSSNDEVVDASFDSDKDDSDEDDSDKDDSDKDDNE